jgi:hypothetical protein
MEVSAFSYSAKLNYALPWLLMGQIQTRRDCLGQKKPSQATVALRIGCGNFF